jgi:hypothetical protein
MSDKLTPDELAVINQYYEHDKQSVVHNLLAHIAAVEAERDQAAALLREIADDVPLCYDDMENAVVCVFCSRYFDHAPECFITRIRAWLAKVESEQETD